MELIIIFPVSYVTGSNRPARELAERLLYNAEGRRAFWYVHDRFRHLSETLSQAMRLRTEVTFTVR